MPTEVTKTGPEQLGADLPTVVDALVREGISEYLKDTELAQKLIDLVHKQTNLPRIVIAVAIHIFIALVKKGAEAAGTGVVSYTKKVLIWAFYHLPHHRAILAVLAKTSRRRLAELEFEQVVKGEIRPNKAKLSAFLAPEKQVQLAMQSWLNNIERMVDRQPVLDISVVEESQSNRFLYATRKSGLVGRDEELGALEAFLDAAAQFSWWTIAGPGGVGKTRLGLELALRKSGAWRSGFMRSFDDFDWANWNPKGPTLLIADYANENAATLGEIAHILTVRYKQGTLPFPIRLLLVTRDAEGDWWQEFRRTGTRRALLEETQFRKSLVISELTDDDLWQVLMSFVPAGAALIDRDTTLRDLLEIDPQRRPLFAAFAGDAIGRGASIRGWDRDALLESVLKREEEHWADCGITEKDKNLLALATLTGGMSTSLVASLPPHLFPTTDSSSYGYGYDPRRYRVLVTEDSSSDLTPLRPDILGESFVLEQLRPKFKGDENRATTFKGLAWRINPNGMFSFLSRAVMDFPESKALRILDSAPSVTDSNVRLGWCGAAANLIGGYMDADCFDDARRIFDELQSLATPVDLNADINTRYAYGLFNMLSGFLGPRSRSIPEREALLQARKIYEDLKTAVEVAQEPVVQKLYAISTRRQAAAFAQAGSSSEAQALYKELRRLSEAFTANIVVQNELATAITDQLSTLSLNESLSLERAEGLYNELLLLSESYPDNVNILGDRAFGAAILISCYGPAGRLSAAEALYEEVCAITEPQLTEHAGLRDARAVAAVNLVASRAPKSSSAMEELRSLRTKFPLDNAILSRLAGALRALVYQYGVSREFDRARSAFDELRSLCADNPNDEEMRGFYARSAFTLLTDYCDAKRAREAGDLYREMQSVVDRYPEDRGVRASLIDASGNYFSLLFSLHGFHEAIGVHQFIVNLAEQNPDDPKAQSLAARLGIWVEQLMALNDQFEGSLIAP